MSLLLTLAVLAIDPTAARTDVSGGISGEVRGGWAPVQLNEPSSGAFVLVVSPNVDLRHANRRQGIVAFGYSPRLFLRMPNRLSITRPLFFHQFDVAYDRPISRAWQFRTQGSADVGELDYTAASLAFDPGQTALPDVSVLSFLIVDGGFGFTGQVAPRTTLGIATSAGTRRPLTQDSDEGVRPFPDRVYANLSIGPRFQVTARDAISLAAIASINDFDPGAIFGAGDLRVAWLHTLRRNLEIVMDAGVFVTRVVARQDDNTDNDGATFPVGGIGLNGRLRARARYTLDGGGAVGFSGLFDSISGRLLYRVRANARLLATFPPRWSAGLDASFITSPTPEPIRVTGGFPVPETLAQVQAPIRYSFDDTKNIEFGAIFGVRAPHLAAQSFSSVRYEAWAYVAFRIGGGTARGGREVRSRRTAS
jgi:hypothetical protein